MNRGYQQNDSLADGYAASTRTRTRRRRFQQAAVALNGTARGRWRCAPVSKIPFLFVSARSNRTGSRQRQQAAGQANRICQSGNRIDSASSARRALSTTALQSTSDGCECLGNRPQPKSRRTHAARRTCPAASNASSQRQWPSRATAQLRQHPRTCRPARACLHAPIAALSKERQRFEKLAPTCCDG